MPVNIGTVQKLTSPNPFALVSTRRADGGTNLMALSWWTYASNHPATVIVCLSKKGLSGELISENGEFGLNIVDESLQQAALSCGTCSGRTVNKPEEFGIPLMDGEVIHTCLVKGAKAALECRLVNTVEAGDHNVFIAEVAAIHTDPEKNQLYAWDGYKELAPAKR